VECLPSSGSSDLDAHSLGRLEHIGNRCKGALPYDWRCPRLTLACPRQSEGKSVAAMKQLPGRSRPRWLRRLSAMLAGIVAAIWLVTLLPVLLVVGLVAALLLIPVLRELRAELERMERVQQGPPPPLQDVTPWHRKAWNRWRER